MTRGHDLKRATFLLLVLLFTIAVATAAFYLYDPGWGQRDIIDRTEGVEAVPVGSTAVLDVPDTPDEGRFWVHFDIETAFDAAVDIKVLDGDGGAMRSEEDVKDGFFFWKFLPYEHPRNITVTSADDVASGEVVYFSWSARVTVDTPTDIVLYQNTWVLALGLFGAAFVVFALIASLRPSAPLDDDARRFLADVRLWRRGGM